MVREEGLAVKDAPGEAASRNGDDDINGQDPDDDPEVERAGLHTGCLHGQRLLYQKHQSQHRMHASLKPRGVRRLGSVRPAMLYSVTRVAASAKAAFYYDSEVIVVRLPLLQCFMLMYHAKQGWGRHQCLVQKGRPTGIVQGPESCYLLVQGYHCALIKESNMQRRCHLCLQRDRECIWRNATCSFFSLPNVALVCVLA